MSEPRKASGWMANDLRTRFVPKSRMRSGLASISPWLDLVLLLFFFLFVESHTVLKPGVIVDLPEGKFNEGVAGGMVMVVMPVENSSGGGNVVFFDDEPYRTDDAQRMRALKVALSAYLADHDDTTLTIYADKSISHGTVSRLVQMARGIGLDRVNMGISAK